jgi:hypothetical protein
MLKEKGLPGLVFSSEYPCGNLAYVVLPNPQRERKLIMVIDNDTHGMAEKQWFSFVLKSKFFNGKLTLNIIGDFEAAIEKAGIAISRNGKSY